MFQTTRRRLALWYTAVTAVLLLLFASGVYLYVRSTLIERIDDTLNHVVEVVQRSLVIEPLNPRSEGGPLWVNVQSSFRDNAATNEDDRIDIEWFSPTGELLWSTFSEPLNVPLHVNNKGETVRISKEQSSLPLPSSSLPIAESLALRQVTHRIEIGRNVLGYLRISHPWFEVTKPSRELFIDLTLGTGIMVASVGAIGWWLSGLAMEPVRESYQRLRQFTADASHELRSPIAVIQTNVQVALADPNPDPKEQQQHLQVIERLTRRLGRLVDDLLFLARQDSGILQARRSAIALDHLLQEVIEEQQTLAKDKGIQIFFTSIEPSSDTSSSSPSAPLLSLPGNRLSTQPATSSTSLQDEWTVLQADRDQLARLFTNLLNNAVQYTLPAGHVFVELQRIGRPGNHCLQIIIRDTGIGISPEALSHIFERFYRVDPARSQTSNKGSGLGLAIAQAIVQNHHGSIQIDSTPNQGTIVTVGLPQKEEG